MALIILGILIVVIVGVIARSNPQAARFAPVGRIIGFIVLAIGILTACIVQIDAGQAGVKVLFGKVQNEVLFSGLHFVNPLLNIEKVDVRTENYTMSGVHDENLVESSAVICCLQRYLLFCRLRGGTFARRNEVKRNSRLCHGHTRRKVVEWLALI